MRATLLLSTLAMPLAGCGITDASGVCTMDVRNSVSVIVRDSATGAPAAEGARGTIRDGAYTDSLRVSGTEYMASANTYEQPGLFEVVIDKPGYLRWTRQLRVREGECHVEAETPVARLRAVR